MAAVACRRSTIGGDVERLESAGSRYGAARPGGEATRGAVVSHARVFLLRIGRGEKIEEPGRGNAVRLQLHALAYNLGNFMRTLAIPKTAEPWSLTSLREKLIKIGAKVVSHGRYVTARSNERPIFVA